MDTQHQRNRHELEVERYPHLATEIVRRDPAFCQHMTDMWQVSVIDSLRLIPVRLSRPVAFETFGHWGRVACLDYFATACACPFLCWRAVQASAVDATSPFVAMLCVDCALIADVGASPRDANRRSADWHLLAVERLHAALAFIAVNLLFDVNS